MPKLTITACAAGLALAAGSAAAKDAAPSPSEEPLRAELGQPAPDFTLKGLDGKEYRLGDYEGKVVVLEWFNPDCPFVKKHHKNNKTMAETYARFRDDGVVWLAINSGGPGKQGHGKERNLRAKEEYGVVYPLLLDETGSVGRTYEAKTTPHMYVIDRDGILVYRGAIDDNRSPGTLGKTNYVADCLTALFAGKHPEPMETKSYGCSVKYSSKAPSLP